LAFRWYDELPLEKKMLKYSMLRIGDAKWASQKLRHKAKKEISRICHVKESLKNDKMIFDN